MIKVTIKNLSALKQRFKGIPGFIDVELQKSIQQSAYLIERESKKETPVLTGRLRSSIRTDIGTQRAVIGPHTNYAFYVHEGLGSNSRKGRRPFMETGLYKAEPNIRRIFNNFSSTIERKFNA